MREPWRNELRVRMLLRLLLEEHVPAGTLARVVERVMATPDADLVNEQRHHAGTLLGGLSRTIYHDLTASPEEPPG